MNNKGTLTINEGGIWMVKWSDLHSFTHGTHWSYTELSSDSNSIKYIKDGEIRYKPLEEGLELDFEIVTTGYDEVNFTPINFAKLESLSNSMALENTLIESPSQKTTLP